MVDRDSEQISSGSKGSSVQQSKQSSNYTVLPSDNNEDEEENDGIFKIPTVNDEKDTEVESELFGLTEDSSIYITLITLTRQSIPVIISFFLGIGGTFIVLVFAGNYVHESGDKSTVLAGVSLANMFANVTWLSILIGMSTAVETLCSQQNGAGNYKEVGIVLQRSFVILGTLLLPTSILWFYVSDIFLFLGVEPAVCNVIKKFIRIRILTMPIDVLTESYEKYLMAIGVVEPSMWANITFNLSILCLCLLFVHVFKFNYECLAWAWVISVYLASLLQFSLSFYYDAVKRTLQPWDKRAWTEWFEFCKLGFPGTVMLCSEWWAYEILTIFASILGTPEVAAQTIILQTASLAFMIPLGLGISSSSLIGNSIGAQYKLLAIRIGKLSIASILVLEIFISMIMLFFGSYFVDLFTNDENVKEVANNVVPFLAIFTLIDGLQGVLAGILRGVGKQYIGAVLNIIAFYVIGLPMAWILCFKLNFSVDGLMIGIAFGTSFQVILLLIIVLGFESYTYSSSVVTIENKHILLPATDNNINDDDYSYSNNDNNNDNKYDEENTKVKSEIEMIEIKKT